MICQHCRLEDYDKETGACPACGEVFEPIGGTMELVVRRRWLDEISTIGELSINGMMRFYTLEDKVREVEGHPVETWKIKGKTAIPRGRYEVKLTPSAKFGRIMPQIMNVPGFEGIRIHSGNTAVDTEGCLLVGSERGSDTILHSKNAFNELFGMLEHEVKSGGKIYITIS